MLLDIIKNLFGWHKFKGSRVDDEERQGSTSQALSLMAAAAGGANASANASAGATGPNTSATGSVGEGAGEATDEQQGASGANGEEEQNPVEVGEDGSSVAVKGVVDDGDDEDDSGLPLDCSGVLNHCTHNGLCVQGRCYCAPQFTGMACDVSKKDRDAKASRELAAHAGAARPGDPLHWIAASLVFGVILGTVQPWQHCRRQRNTHHQKRPPLRFEM